VSWLNGASAHFGLKYAYESRQALEGPPIPEYLLGVRTKLAVWAEVRAEDLVEAIVTEYAPGAGIGWHRDAGEGVAVLDHVSNGEAVTNYAHQKAGRREAASTAVATGDVV
jgi:alkylated DNA repair dioxygenase AlkB